MTKRETLDAAARGEGCLGKSQDDEPVFVLVARDRYAASTVRKWAETVAHFHGYSEKIDEAYAVANEAHSPDRVGASNSRYDGWTRR